MNSLNMGLFGNDLDLLQKIANAFGKKGTTSDITLYDTKFQDKIITSLLPHSYPEKIQSLFYAIYLSDIPILAFEKADSILGEIILALDAANFKKGIIFSKDYNYEQIKAIIKGTSLEKYEFFEYKDDTDINELRLKCFEETTIQEDKNNAFVAVDHSFSVKGVGTVVLGILKNGNLKVYDKLKIQPGNKETAIRSIQKHDDNFQTAEPGDRVGLCLKDVSVEDVPRGAVISSSPSVLKKATLEISANKFIKEPIKQEQVFYISLGMQYISFKVESGEIKPGEKGTVSVLLEKEVACVSGQRFFVLNPNQKMRIVGFGEIK